MLFDWISPILDTMQGYNHAVKKCHSYEESLMWCVILESKGIKARATDGGLVVVRKEDVEKVRELK
jgi:hypothetical protein